MSAASALSTDSSSLQHHCLIYSCVCVCVCVCVCGGVLGWQVCACKCMYLLELELEVVVSHPIWEGAQQVQLLLPAEPPSAPLKKALLGCPS